jgi:hypothetical protein
MQGKISCSYLPEDDCQMSEGADQEKKTSLIAKKFFSHLQQLQCRLVRGPDIELSNSN